ncbi:MAG: sigma-54-dependent Fis family transcriptional regulator [Bacteroidales bacterium]|jgi:transcriptional regulator with PAS, ATPase and Fis domain|nr:sigma-54-dependent Fis family transcriptional regulator [Bacteroidales bacterium]MBR4228856.1 sigma-54-dependent Fis family transcriptional regulator [Bacteroidales bacterium]
MDSQELQRLKNRYDIIGNDPALNRALETAVAVAPTDLTVLVSGESGVGKENIPRIIHQNSLRRNGKYFAVNCGGIPEGTINSELFGHEKGSFTGATETRKGYFEEANGGTLFLDEVGELPMSTQVMLLRVLQNGEYIKVGSSKVEKTDVRVVAATNVNLLYAVSQGKFREDLYYRLNAIQIRMPALRERKDDIYLFFRKFTSDFSEKYRVCKINLTHDAIIALRNYRWPGNIRQLKNVAETVSALESVKLTPGAERCEIDSETLRKYLPKEEETVLPAVSEAHGSAFNEDEKKMLIKALLDLRQEVDQLKMAVYGGQAAQHRLPGPAHEVPEAREPEPYDEADWQEPDTQEQAPAESPDLSLQKVSEDLIQKALEKHNGNRKAAAEELGISERTLYRRLAKEKK